MYFLQELLSVFDPDIENEYLSACSDAEVDAFTTPLIISDTSHTERLYKSEFIALSSGEVQITRNGLASLWACSQGIARIIRPMFDLQRTRGKNDETAILKINPELETGFHLFALSLRLAKNKFDQWVEWAPKPTLSPCDVETRFGNTLFFGSLSWIMRHELAHIKCGHLEHSYTIPQDLFLMEFEADKHATSWMVSNLPRDKCRPLEPPPSGAELKREKAALLILVGGIWLIQFECIPHGKSQSHPDAARRINTILDTLDLADDSFAYECLTYAIKVLIAPEDSWPTSDTTREALNHALILLSRHIQDRIA